MREEVVKVIVDKYVADETFRADVRTDPASAIRKAGFELDDEELALLSSLDFTLTDEQLSERLAASSGYGDFSGAGHAT